MSHEAGLAECVDRLNRLRALAACEDEETWEAAERLEAAILLQVPKTLEDAALLTGIVIENLALGTRSDGLDIDALGRVQSFLKARAEAATARAVSA